MKLYPALLSILIAVQVVGASDQPNILWIVTDDQRYDSIRAFNQMLTGEEMSPLGYVESPQVDKLAAAGTTFINAYCQAMGCAPSRASMHYGRYPFRSGIYEFEYHNTTAPHREPSIPEHLAELGYHTVQIGKLGFRLRQEQPGGWMKAFNPYAQSISFRELAAEGLVDWGRVWINELDGVKLDEPLSNLRFFVLPDGEIKYFSLEVEELFPDRKGDTVFLNEEFDLLRHHNARKPPAKDKGMILSGVSPQPAGKTRDAYYNVSLSELLANENQTFKMGELEFDGVDPSKPLFVHLGYDFPHTPVLPPADYRERFQRYTYELPELTEEELETMPEQLKRATSFGASDHYTDEEKQKMIQDYFAFCAYGDALVGQAAKDFVEYSNRHGQPWMIVYVCGDHGWKLNEHGSVSKFTPWNIDQQNPIIVVSSDRAAFPAGKVVRDFTEFVDIAPTILAAAGADLGDPKFDYLDGFDMARIASGEQPSRDYVTGESHAVTGPRAFIRMKDFVFSMQTRPDKSHGGNMDWGLTAAYEDVDPALYHMPSDPGEVNNLAFNPEYRDVANAMREKLGNIVLGDNRVEVNWGPKADGVEIFRSNFAPDAHDGQLEL
ncbi:MAG: sulfatase-like hydrolase/transferase [Verrucomicrobiota bacterium]